MHLWLAFFMIACCMACSSDTTDRNQEGASAPTGEKPQALRQITFGYQPSTHQIAFMTAWDKGWWRQALEGEGIAVLNEKVFPTGAPEMQAMLTGRLDVAYVGAAPFITALGQGLDAKVVAAVQNQGSDLVLRPEYPYNDPEDLKGLTIATFPPGTIQDTLLRGWLMKNGIDPKKDVDIRGMGPGDAISAIGGRNVAAVFLPHPAPAIIETEGNGRSVVRSGQMEPGHACCVLVATGGLIREYPSLVEKIVAVHIRATRYNIAHPDEAAQIFSARTGFDVEKVKKSLRDWDGAWLTDPADIAASAVAYAKIQNELGYIDKSLTEDDIFDHAFYRAAAASAR